jgi:hypothetical protein
LETIKRHQLDLDVDDLVDIVTDDDIVFFHTYKWYEDCSATFWKYLTVTKHKRLKFPREVILYLSNFNC